MKTIDVIIPTYNNYEQLGDCIQSMLNYASVQPIHVIVVNNGSQNIEIDSDHVTILKPLQNLGWEGGLQLGLEQSESEYVLFANDDIFIPRSSIYWLREMLRIMEHDKGIGAVGPSSNVVAGMQNIWHPDTRQHFYTPTLIGFCVLVRREALNKAGGVDNTLPGGDDLDLSIRLRGAGYKLVVAKDVFVYHHGFQTGTQLYGTPDKPGGWNSKEMSDNTNIALVKKHGLKKWFETVYGNIFDPQLEDEDEDVEGDIIRQFVRGKRIVELGCGGTKTVENAIGVDLVPNGQEIPTIGQKSVADIVGSVENVELDQSDTIIARHILEHCVDTIKTLKHWNSLLKNKGLLIVTLPNEVAYNSIAVNPEHKHTFTPESIKTLAEICGFKEIERKDTNTQAFVSVFEKESR